MQPSPSGSGLAASGATGTNAFRSQLLASVVAVPTVADVDEALAAAPQGASPNECDAVNDAVIRPAFETGDNFRGRLCLVFHDASPSE